LKTDPGSEVLLNTPGPTKAPIPSFGVCNIKSARCGMLENATKWRPGETTWPHVSFEVKHKEQEGNR
jgi:hypothetical protein